MYVICMPVAESLRARMKVLASQCFNGFDLNIDVIDIRGIHIHFRLQVVLAYARLVLTYIQDLSTSM